MSAAEPVTGTQAVRRAVAVLEAFTDVHPTWNVGELAAATGLNRTTAHRILKALESVDYVTRDPSDHYRLGSGLMALGARARRANPIRAVALPEIERLAATGETATLELLSGPEVVIIEEIPGEFVTSASRNVGSQWPAHATSTGKAILSHLPPGEWPSMAGRLEPFTDKTITSIDELRDCLREAHRLGYAVAAEELELDYVAVGAAVFDAGGHPVAAVSLGGTRGRLTDERLPELGALVRAAAGRISYRLGYRG
jgi:IclR family acetate operon transcriptional repressor